MITIDPTSDKPLYAQIREAIKYEIVTGRYKPGEQLPTEKELVELLSVSTITVKRAIDDLVGEGLLYRRPRHGTFVTSYRERTRIVGSKLIGALLPAGPRDYFCFQLIRGFLEGLQKRGYQLILAYADEDPDEERRQLEQLMDNNVEGMVVWHLGSDFSKNLIEGLLTMDVPFVLVDRYVPGLVTDYVGTENFQGTYDAIEMLIQNGHRRIAHITRAGSDSTTVTEKMQGYMAALNTYELPIDQQLIGYATRTALAESIHHILDELFENPNPPTAVFSINSNTTVAILRYIASKSLSLPANFTLAGFDELDSCFVEGLKLVTVKQQLRQIGAAAIDFLFEQIEHERPQGRQLRLAPKLVVSHTTVNNGMDMSGGVVRAV
ncbi:MAG: GntR family transcriptional regulator [Firmicutes bacterium]|nr:GntR family transcriptional regulator [Bacillota bacterium]